MKYREQYIRLKELEFHFAKQGLKEFERHILRRIQSETAEQRMVNKCYKQV